MAENYKHSEITDLIIKAFYKVYNKLGYGFLERVYLNALVLELLSLELVVKKEHPIIVFYNGMEVGKYIADLIVNDCIIVELKATEILKEEHEAQLTNYLRATEIDVGLLLNFGKKPQIKRKVFTSIKNE